jgi:hypothetical protein
MDDVSKYEGDMDDDDDDDDTNKEGKGSDDREAKRKKNTENNVSDKGDEDKTPVPAPCQVLDSSPIKHSWADIADDGEVFSRYEHVFSEPNDSSLDETLILVLKPWVLFSVKKQMILLEGIQMLSILFKVMMVCSRCWTA